LVFMFIIFTRLHFIHTIVVLHVTLKVSKNKIMIIIIIIIMIIITQLI